MRRAIPILPLVAIGLTSMAGPLPGQWTHRYPKVEGYSHHVYLEGYELPTLSAGPLDAVPSPDGRSIAFASRGWLWILERESGTARRITRGGALDSRPAWSPDGRSIAFVRDDTRDTRIVLLELETGDERVLVDEPALDLDPAFGPDGRSLYYSSAAAGDLDIWCLDLATGERTRVTDREGIELRPIPHPDGERLIYLAKGGGPDRIVVHSLATGEERMLTAAPIASQARPALAPDGRTLAYNWPDDDGWELRLLDIERPETSVRLASGLPLTPAWGPDGAYIYYSEAGPDERMSLKRIPAVGGRAEPVHMSRWEWDGEMARVWITTRRAAADDPIPARIGVLDANGHPVIPDGQSWFDGQNGRVFFYSPGTIELLVPAGEIRITAVRGLATPPARLSANVRGGETLELELEPVWDPRADGWYSGDHHFHLNYGGPYRLDPEDLVPMARGEDLDVATPLAANLHDRWEDERFWGWERLGSSPWIAFGQEVRPHFLGHTGHVGTHELFWPWIWGPGYQVYGRDDRPNAVALLETRRQGGVNSYVHPVSRPEPFAEDTITAIPVALVADAVLGTIDALEVACLWSDELGTADVWYRILNLGIPVALTAGTDVMKNFYRTMAVGTTRVYVRPDGPMNYRSYLAALRAGRSFVTNGPLLDFRVREAGSGDDLRPGDVVARDGSSAAWALDVHSAVPVERVEILVNGEPVWSGSGLSEPGRRSYSGRLDLPEGGWIAARAHGGAINDWPAMDSYAFASTGPIWIGEIGSTEPAAERSAARDLLTALNDAEARLVRAYTEAPRLREQFEAARRELQERIGETNDATDSNDGG